MSAWSEETTFAGWMSNLEQTLALEGGVWEVLGRAIGWPIGWPIDYRAVDGWETWDEAVYRAHKHRLEYLLRDIAYIEEHPDTWLLFGVPRPSTDHLYELLGQSRDFVAEYEKPR